MSYAKAKANYAAEHGESAPASSSDDEQLPCRFCPNTAPRKVLSLFGARCMDCYRQYERLGYSGAEPPQQIRQADWVGSAKKRAQEAPRSPVGAFAGMAEAMHNATEVRQIRRAELAGLDDDQVNAQLQLAGGVA